MCQGGRRIFEPVNLFVHLAVKEFEIAVGMASGQIQAILPLLLDIETRIARRSGRKRDVLFQYSIVGIHRILRTSLSEHSSNQQSAISSDLLSCGWSRVP